MYVCVYIRSFLIHWAYTILQASTRDTRMNQTKISFFKELKV